MDESASLYASHPLTHPRDIRVIDIVPSDVFESPLVATMNVIKIPNIPSAGRSATTGMLARTDSYQALSYAWGTQDRHGHISVDGSTMPITTNLRDALRRVREHATRECSLIRRLWVDAICINQEYHNERQHQVSIMADIYRLAEQLVIWLGECSQQDLEDMQAIALLPGRALSRKNAIFRKILTSPWFQRRWVIQEALLTEPMKRLALYGSSVQHLHDISISLQRYAMEETQRHAHLALSPVIRWGETLIESPLMQNLLTFRDSQCHEPHDYIYALLGISLDGHLVPIDYEERIEHVYRRLALDWARDGLAQLLACATLSSETALSIPYNPSWIPFWHHAVTPGSDWHRDAVEASLKFGFPSLKASQQGLELKTDVPELLMAVVPDYSSSSTVVFKILDQELVIWGWLLDSCSHQDQPKPSNQSILCSCTFATVILERVKIEKPSVLTQYLKWDSTEKPDWPDLRFNQRILWFEGSRLGFIIRRTEEPGIKRYRLESCFKILPIGWYNDRNYRVSRVHEMSEIASGLSKIQLQEEIRII